MANTTNFGWETPDDTDLVKDGAAAMRTLGNSIDASFVDLKGGTTGQVLAKASNTDLDFIWSNDAGISPTIVDAKGDLITATAADTPARLGVGTNGQVLQADSTTATGLRWATPASGAFTLLASGTLSGSNLDLTSISSGYEDLRLVLTNYALSSRGNMQMTFNGDTAGNYNSVSVYNYQGSAPALTNLGFGATYFWVNNSWNVSTTTNVRNVTVIDIPDYTQTDANKIVREAYYVNDNTGSTSQVIGNSSGYWAGTAAINRITVDPEGTRTWTAGNYYLFGVK